ncbi:MAG: 3-hydroxyacyl-CoA dehydrogenase family protein [Frankia sp.]
MSAPPPTAPHPTDRVVTIVGAGLMGIGIAEVFAAAGLTVRLCDPEPKARLSVPDRLATACAAAGVEPGAVAARVTVFDSTAEACQSASVVIEAGPESSAIKRAILAEVEAAVPARTLLATNTSSIPVGELASALERPGRFVGAHFWQPPYLVPLVEVVRGPRSDPSAMTAMIDLLGLVGLRPIRVDRDVPGVIGNRLQHALKREAIALVSSGVATAEAVDAVVRHGFGRRLALVGPLEQADLGGLDLTMAIHEVLMPDLDVTPAPHPLLRALVEQGSLGAKTGRGFYDWAPGQAEQRRAEIARGLAGQATGEPSPEGGR